MMFLLDIFINSPHCEFYDKEERSMAASILNGKTMLVVDDEQDVLTVVEEEILESCPDSKIDKASNYEQAAQLLKSKDYAIVILDIMGVRGFDLLEIAVTRKLKVAMLTAHALSSEALKKSHDMGAMAYLPKDKLGGLVPFLEDVWLNQYEASWKSSMDKLGKFFDIILERNWRVKSGIDY
jgi:DNA-binding NtrC family response regulator